MSSWTAAKNESEIRLLRSVRILPYLDAPKRCPVTCALLLRPQQPAKQFYQLRGSDEDHQF